MISASLQACGVVFPFNFHFDLPQKRYDLLRLVPLDRHDRSSSQVNSLSLHLVQKSPVRSLLTLHRPSNVDNRETLTNILSGLEELAKDQPIIFPAHPRTQQRIKDFGLELSNAVSGNAAPKLLSKNIGIMLVDPLGYLDFLCLVKHATIVVTDSGGIQE